MITSQIIVRLLIAGAAICGACVALALLTPKLTRAWGRSGVWSRFVFVFSASIMLAFGGTKQPTNTTNGANALRRLAAPRPAHASMIRPLFAAPAGYELIAAFTDSTHDFAASSAATTNTNWTAHGAYEAWCSILDYAAFTGGYLRTTPRNGDAEIGYHDLDYLAAIPGLSAQWWMQTNGTFIATWQNFVRGDNTNDLLSVQIELSPLECTIRANEDVRVYGRVYCPTNDPSLMLSLEAPRGVIKNGEARSVTASLQSIQTVVGTVRIDCPIGHNHVAFYRNAARTMPLHLPIEFDAHEFSEYTFYVGWASTSEEVDDVELTLTLTGTDEGNVETRTARLTAAEIIDLDLTSTYAEDADELAPPFPAGADANFNVEKSKGYADRHLLIPFSSVVLTNPFSVRDFSVHATLNLSPAGYSENVTWRTLSGTPSSGSLVTTGSNTADLRNPKVGGVYRLAASLGGIETQGVVVLPLAGAGVDEVLRNDLNRANAFVEFVQTNLTTRHVQRVAFAYYWLGQETHGFYRGRSNHHVYPTVWCYNGVSDTTGLGSVITLSGYPIYLEKLSNLLAGFVAQKLNYSPWEQARAQSFGTPNTESGNRSWALGAEFAESMTNLTERVNVLANLCWGEGKPKPSRLWPNPAAADNHTLDSRANFNYYLTSPGFLNPQLHDLEYINDYKVELYQQFLRDFISRKTSNYQP